MLAIADKEMFIPEYCRKNMWQSKSTSQTEKIVRIKVQIDIPKHYLLQIYSMHPALPTQKERVRKKPQCKYDIQQMANANIKAVYILVHLCCIQRV